MEILDHKKQKMRKNKMEVVVIVMGGVAQAVKIPAGVRVKIVDYDVDATETDFYKGEPVFVSEEEGPYYEDN